MKLQIMSVQFASFPDQSFQLSKIPYSHFLSPSNFKSTIKIQLIFLPSKSDVAKKLHEIPFSLFKHCNQINSSRNLRVTSQLVKIQKSHAFLLLLTFPRDSDSWAELPDEIGEKLKSAKKPPSGPVCKACKRVLDTVCQQVVVENSWEISALKTQRSALSQYHFNWY